jgi:hypothetical protein
MNREGETSKCVWLVGSSEKPKLLGAALCGIATWGPEASGLPHELTELGDLEELLFGQAQQGTLILDYESVPIEDIGFVRRFLARNANWRLLVLGEQEAADCAERMLKLANSSWLNWPPNLDKISQLLPATAEQVGHASEILEELEPIQELTPEARPIPELGAINAPDSGIDLHTLFKELLINEHLAGHKWVLELEDALRLEVDLRLAKLSFGAFINLARACSGREGLVKAQLDREGQFQDPTDTVCLRLTFAHGGLQPQDRSIVLQRTINAEGKLGSAAKAALIAAEALRKRGGRVQMLVSEAGVLCLEMHISSRRLTPTTPLEEVQLEDVHQIGSLPDESVSSAHDPFA